MSEIINRNENIVKKINEIKSIESQYDLTLKQSTTTEAVNRIFRNAYNSRNDSDETKEFFSVVTELFELAGYHHIGSGILYTHYYTTIAWERYQETVMPIIESYIEDNLWDDICNSDWKEESQ
jgi:hypothetical protein